MGQGQSEDGVVGPNPGDENTMRAYVMECPGKISDARLASVYMPKPEAGEIRVKVICAGINSVDYKRCQFKDAEFPCILGADVAGIVDQVGPDVINLKPGDKVYYHSNVRKQYGAFAEYALTSAITTALIPDGLTFVEAAAIPCSGWTSYLALYHKLRVCSGQSILITGASGGVGCYSIQLAKLSGLTVFATCQSHKIDFVKSMGADYVFSSDNSEEVLASILAITNGQLIDHVLDTVGSTSATNSIQYLKIHGSLCSLAGLINDPKLFDKGISVHYITLGGMHQSPSNEPKSLLASVGRDIGMLFASKQMKVPIMEVCEMEQIPSALEQLRKGQVQGKLVAHIIPLAQRVAQPSPPPQQAPIEQPLRQNKKIQQQAVTYEPTVVPHQPTIPQIPTAQSKPKPKEAPKKSSGWLF